MQLLPGEAARFLVAVLSVFTITERLMSIVTRVLALDGSSSIEST